MKFYLHLPMIALLLTAHMLSQAVLCRADEGQAVEGQTRLRLKDGSYSLGTLVGSEYPNRLGWKAEGFRHPFHFDFAAVRSIAAVYQPGEEPKTATQGQLFELTNGELLAGTLVAIEDDWIGIDSNTLGPLKVDRSKVLSMVDAGYAGKIVYSGLINDSNWKLSKEDDWRFEAGALVATRQGAAIVGDVNLPSKAQINLVLAWKGVADFVFSFGTLATNKVSRADEVPAAARIEVWDRQLVLVREEEGGADIAVLSEMTAAVPRIELTIFLDQENGVVTVCDSHGRPLDSVTLVAKRKRVRSSVHLVNNGPSLTLEHFEVRQWDGRTSAVKDEGVVLESSGETLMGMITGFDSATGKVILASSDHPKPLSIPLSDVRRADFLPVTSARQQSGGSAEDSKLPPPVQQPPPLNPKQNKRKTPTTASEFAGLFATEESAAPARIEDVAWADVVLTDRSRLSGQWLPAENGKLRLRVDGVRSRSGENVLALSTNMIRGVIGTNERYVNDLSEHKNGNLRLGTTQLTGYLDANVPKESTTSLYWHPHSSLSSTQILADSSGEIIYRKPLPKVKKSKVARRQQGNKARANPLVQMFLGRPSRTTTNNDSSKTSNTIEAGAREIVFRTGDAIYGVIESVDESGVRFRSSQTTTKHATHAQMQHAWLNNPTRSSESTPVELQRLMTVPRSMKKDPPTHLLMSVTGDYLRCRLVRFEGDMLTVEVRLEMLEIPAAQVAQIVWLHDRKWEDDPGTDEQAEVPEKLAEFRVHGIGTLDQGLTFRPTSMKDGVLAGTSELLGNCSVQVTKLNQLLFGTNIGERIRLFNKDPWTLSLAQYPRVFMDDGTSAGSSQSPLVGTPAPDFGLKTLDGESFRLSKKSDRVVILDFWASWCGPCVQTMPLVEDTVAKIKQEFGEDKVELVAVNIQESQRRVRAAVERLALEATVLLDVDGQVAAAYEANAIPQTVIIDRDGNITHLFVGGGPRFIKQFTEALKTVVGP